MRSLRVTLSLAVAVMALAAAPGPASAAPFTVNSTGDGADVTPGDAVCETATGNGICTLRAAIGEANGLAGTDSIGFSAGVFDGTAATSTIALTSALPLITTQIFIDGGSCVTGGGDPKPCTAINADDGTPPLGFDVFRFFNTVAGPAASSGSSVKRIAIFNADRAILGGSTLGAGTPDNISIEGNWLGMNLSESPGSSADSNNTGVSIATSGWDIGGSTPQERNVFRANSVGVQIRGGDNNTVAGNYFGTRANGTVDTAVNSTSIWIDAQSPPNIPDGTTIGGPDTGTPSICDGPCNLFVSATTAAHIDLEPQPAPAGSTTIQGNFIGLTLAGVHPVGTVGMGIDIGGADAVTIGGAATTARNFIGGGEVGLNAAAGADDLVVQNNYLGVEPDGSGEVAPSVAGATIAASPAMAEDRPMISNNIFAGDSIADQDGLRLTGTGGTVSNNSFGRDASSADRPFGADAVDITGSVYTLTGNQVRNGRGFGINISNGDFNHVDGNTIQGNGAAASGAGVRIHSDADGNVLGGDPVGTPGDVNTFIGNAGDAIEVLDNASTGNLLLGNLTNGVDSATGSGAGDLMIDLNGDGPGNPMAGPNDGVQAPVITSVTATSASGTATPFASVMLYRNSGTETGAPQPAAILGEATADGSGNWTITYAAIPVGRFVFAGQSVSESSSELAGPVQYVLPPPPPPVLTGTDPASPANNNNPKVFGTAEAGSNVTLYPNGTCTPPHAFAGPESIFTSPGFTVTVADNSTTTFSATATNGNGTSTCSTMNVTYTELTPPPVQPTPPTPPQTTTPAVTGLRAAALKKCKKKKSAKARRNCKKRAKKLPV